MKTLYEAQATAIGGRTGSAATADGVLRVALATPKALDGQGSIGTNPEQLFATAYAACFLGAIRLAAGRHDTPMADDSNVTATVGIGRRDDGKGLGLAVGLSIDLPGVDGATADTIVAEAHRTCPYSNALRGNVDVAITIA
jgi:Ohr subfamily peroxiredoxin